MAEPRCPGRVDDPDADRPDSEPDALGADVSRGHDTDADQRPDTLVVDDGVDLVLLTDLDGDGFADRVLRIGPDGVTREVGYRPGEPRDDPFTELPDGWCGC